MKDLIKQRMAQFLFLTLAPAIVAVALCMNLPQVDYEISDDFEVHP